jgi:hypothetical protein
MRSQKTRKYAKYYLLLEKCIEYFYAGSSRKVQDLVAKLTTTKAKKQKQNKTKAKQKHAQAEDATTRSHEP